MNPAINLLGIVITSKRSEQAARAAYSKTLSGPVELCPSHLRAWRGTLEALRIANHAIRRTTRRTVIPFIPRITQ